MIDDKKRIAWLDGSYYARRSMMSKIRQSFAPDDIFQSDSSYTFEYLVTQMQTTGCFSEKRLVIINEMPEFKDSNKQKYIKQFKEVLETLDNDIFVVFNGVSSAKEKSIFGLVEKIGKIYNYPEIIDRKVAPQWVMEFLRKMGYSINHAIADSLVENCGFDSELNGIGSDILEMAIYRLTMCMPNNKKEIDIEEVELSVFEHQNFIVWDLLNAIDVKNYDHCITIMQKVKILDTNIVQAITSVMNTLLWKFRLILFLKDKLNFDKDISRAANAALEMRKLRRQGSGESATMHVDLFKTGDSAGKPQTSWNKLSIQQSVEGFYGREPSINLYNRRDVYRIIRAIQNAIYFLRTVKCEGEAFLLADLVFMTACKTVDDKYIKQIICYFEKAQI